jgi:hypothetical protein
MIAQDTLLVMLVKLVDQIPMPPTAQERPGASQSLFGSLVLESLGDHDRPSSA